MTKRQKTHSLLLGTPEGEVSFIVELDGSALSVDGEQIQYDPSDPRIFIDPSGVSEIDDTIREPVIELVLFFETTSIV